MEITDINIGSLGIGISFSVGKAKKEYAQSLIDFLSGQRILFTPCDLGCKKCKEYSSRSVLKIKERINKQLENIYDSNDYKTILGFLRNSCNNFLDEPLCEKLLANIEYVNKKICPVLKFRNDILYWLVIVIEMFKIEINDDIEKLLHSI